MDTKSASNDLLEPKSAWAWLLPGHPKEAPSTKECGSHTLKSEECTGCLLTRTPTYLPSLQRTLRVTRLHDESDA